MKSHRRSGPGRRPGPCQGPGHPVNSVVSDRCPAPLRGVSHDHDDVICHGPIRALGRPLHFSFWPWTIGRRLPRRSSACRGEPTAADIERMRDAKSVIFDAVRLAVGDDFPPGRAGVLVDEHLGCGGGQAGQGRGLDLGHAHREERDQTLRTRVRRPIRRACRGLRSRLLQGSGPLQPGRRRTGPGPSDRTSRPRLGLGQRRSVGVGSSSSSSRRRASNWSRTRISTTSIARLAPA